MSHLLHPPLLDEAGLESALRWFVEGFAQRSGINVDSGSCPGTWAPFQGDGDRHLSHRAGIACQCAPPFGKQDSAGAGRARRSESDLEIRDQGRGIPANGKAERSEPALPGVGIQGMRERVRQLGGNFEIAVERRRHGRAGGDSAACRGGRFGRQSGAGNRPSATRLPRGSRFNDVIADGVAHQLRHRMAIEAPHDIGAVGLRGFYADIQRHGHFLAALAFGQ